MKKKSEIKNMRNLGPASEKSLNTIGIYTRKDLEKIGPQSAFKKMQKEGLKPHICFLYAMIGAIEDVHWIEVCRLMKMNEDRF